MANKNLSAIRAIVRQKLRDEFQVDADLEFENDELDIYIADCLDEISEHCPYEVKETLTTTAGSRELDISSIEDLLDGGIDEVEFRVGKFPKQMRSCSIFGNTLTIGTDLYPSADEDVYLYCRKLHQLTESTSTLKPQLERILVLGVTGKAAIAKARTLIDKVNVGGARTPDAMKAWGEGKLVLYLRALEKITTPRGYVNHPRS